MQCGKDCDYLCNKAMYWGSSASLRKGIKYSYLCKLFFFVVFFYFSFPKKSHHLQESLMHEKQPSLSIWFHDLRNHTQFVHRQGQGEGDTKLVWKKGLKPKIGLSFNNYCRLIITFTFLKIKQIKDEKMLSWLKQSELKSKRVPFRYLHLKMPNF